MTFQNYRKHVKGQKNAFTKNHSIFLKIMNSLACFVVEYLSTINQEPSNHLNAKDPTNP